MIKILALGWLLLSANAFAATVNSSLYILRDSIAFDDGVKLPYATFNESNTFSQKNAQISTNLGDQWVVWVVNFDAIAHQFEIKNEIAPATILPGDSIQITYDCNTAGVYIFQDPTSFPDYAATGLAGILVVKESQHPHFYWNIKEHQVGYNANIFAGGTGDWSNYYPDYYTINGNSNPNINSDPTARVIGSVGDTLEICVANTGQSIHALHFHGYHVEIKASSKSPSHVGRSKDSVPVYPSETMLLRLIPDKEGEYPVHDHNLIGTTGANIYPMGMFTTLLIAP